MTLILKKTASYYADPSWSKDDFVVLNGRGEIIGSIFLAPQAPAGRDWLWMIAARE